MSKKESFDPLMKGFLNFQKTKRGKKDWERRSSILENFDYREDPDNKSNSWY